MQARSISAIQSKDEKRPIDKLGEEQSHDVGRALAAIGSDRQRHHFQPADPGDANRRDRVAGDWATRKSSCSTTACGRRPRSRQFKALLNRHKDKASIMVVGHDPSMTEFVNRVLSGGAPAGGDRDEEGRSGQGGKRYPPAGRAEVVHAAESRAEDSAQFGEEVASEDGLEVAPLLFDSPKLQFNPFRGSRREAEAHRSVLLYADVQLTNRAPPSLVQGARQPRTRLPWAPPLDRREEPSAGLRRSAEGRELPT